MEEEVWGSMKISYNVIPARTVNCEWYYLLCWLTCFAHLQKTTLFQTLL